METNEQSLRHEAHIHYIAAFIGGFLGIFPIVNAAHFFGSAQTANLIDIVLDFFAGDWFSIAFDIIGVLLYCMAIILVTFIPKHTRLNVKILAMAVDCICALVMWRFPHPDKLPLNVYLYPTFFAMAFQWSAFKGAYGFVSATIFSSNNLKQFVSALTEIFLNGDKSYTLKAKFFGATLLAFHLGVAASGTLWHLLGNAGFLFVIIPAGAGALLLKRK